MSAGLNRWMISSPGSIFFAATVLNSIGMVAVSTGRVVIAMLPVRAMTTATALPSALLTVDVAPNLLAIPSRLSSIPDASTLIQTGRLAVSLATAQRGLRVGAGTPSCVSGETPGVADRCVWSRLLPYAEDLRQRSSRAAAVAGRDR